MIKNFCAILMALCIVSCGSDAGSKKLMTESGYEYTHKQVGTEKVKEGDYVTVALVIEGSDGKVLQSMVDETNMPVLQIPTAENPLPAPNPIIDAISGASVGDSVTIIMPMDSMPSAKNNPLTSGMEYIKYVTYVSKVQNEKDYKMGLETKRLEMEAAAEKSKLRIPEIQTMIESTIADYKSKKLVPVKLDSGLEYIIHEEGDGIEAEDGMRASVHYYGVTMDGKMFDNSFKRGAPYPFTLGRGEVIKGWDVGIAALRKGTKATLIIPYDMAYGEAGSPPNIGPKSDLVFYVEVADLN